MRSFERFVVSLDVMPWSAIWRMALGLVIPPMLNALSGGRDRIWFSLGLFLGLLLLLRIVPVILRRVGPFSRDAKDIWADRRSLSKQHDSYQWQKLFWIGLGMLPALAIGKEPSSAALVIAAICLIGGGAGLFFWYRVNAAQPAK